MKNLLYSGLAATFVFGLILSCAEKQDFDQYDSLQITPVAALGIVYLESPENVINDANAAVYYSADFNFDAFEEKFVSENLLDGVMTYELENTTSKDLELLVEFLDANGNVLDTELFRINAAPAGILRRDTAYGGASGKSIDIIKNTSGIRVTGRNLGDTTSVSALPDPKIILRSSAAFRIRLK
jgi:hypothetical protein